MLDTHGRSLYQRTIVEPSLRLFKGFSPTEVTIIGIIGGMAIVPLLAFQLSYLAFGMLVLTGFLDTIDGSLARYRNQTTSFGAALDITGDRIVEFSVIFGLYLFQPHERALSCLIMLGSILVCVTSFLVVGIFTQNQSEKSFHYSPGLMERTEAFILFALMILVPQAFFILAPLFTLLVLLTAVVRLWQFWKHNQNTCKS